MSSPYSTKRGELCRHETLRPGCLSCKQEAVQSEREEAMELTEGLPEMIAAFEHKISCEKDVTKHAGLEAEKQKRKAEVEAFVHCVNLNLDLVKREIEAICAENKPDMLPQAFEEDAEVRELATTDTWRKNASETELAYPSFKDEDLARAVSFAGLDRSNIPALPDYLLRDPTGLKTFLRSAKGIEHAHPLNVIGGNPGRAVMSQGAAEAMFGVQPVPGTDYPPKPTTEQALGALMISTKAQPELSTELDVKKRDRGEQALVKSKFKTEEKQWALFGPDTYQRFVDLLISEYVRLVMAKSEHVRAMASRARVNAATANVPVSPDETGGPSTTSRSAEDDALRVILGQWPDVQELDWDSFANWVLACQKLDKKFGRVTLMLWENDKVNRQALAKSIEAWSYKAAVAAGYDDGCSGSKPPTTYWSKKISIMQWDAPLAGIDARTGKPVAAKTGRNRR